MWGLNRVHKVILLPFYITISLNFVNSEYSAWKFSFPFYHAISLNCVTSVYSAWKYSFNVLPYYFSTFCEFWIECMKVYFYRFTMPFPWIVWDLNTVHEGIVLPFNVTISLICVRSEYSAWKFSFTVLPYYFTKLCEVWVQCMNV